MIQIETASGQEVIVAPCLRLRFSWVGDHWKQEMVSVGDSVGVPMIWSVEANNTLGDHSRVVSPTYQQIDVRMADSVARALLVGQAGPHHFSAAVEVSEAANGVVVDVDVADRCREPVEALAATYVMENAAGQLHQGGAGGLVWDHATHHLIFEADPPTRVLAASHGFGSLQVQALATIDPAARTHRFRYRWRWINEPDAQIWDRTA